MVVVFYLITDFVAQLLLCLIFWDLGTKQELVEEEPERLASVDEDSEMQARIWNRF